MLKQGNLFELSHNVGTITEFMKSRRIRSISARNYIKWKGYGDVESMFPIATVRLDLFDGRLKMFDHNNKMLYHLCLSHCLEWLQMTMNYNKKMHNHLYLSLRLECQRF